MEYVKGVHLGSRFGNDVLKSQIAIGELYGRSKLMLAQFGNAFSNVKYSLFQSFCMSLYGCSLWDFFIPICIKILHCIEKMYCNLLSLICADMTVNHNYI